MSRSAGTLFEELTHLTQAVKENGGNGTASSANVRDTDSYYPEDDYDKKDSVVTSLEDLGPDFKYNLNHSEKSCFLVICNDVFQNLSARSSEVDLNYLREIAKNFNFLFRVLHNKTKEEIMGFLRKLTSKEYTHENYDYFFCVILTHGGKRDSEEILYVKDGDMKLTDITDFFNADGCKTLAHKPKCFFIQACRGGEKDNDLGSSVPPPTKYSSLTEVESDAALYDEVESDAAFYDEDLESEEEKVHHYYIPKDADFMFAYSTPPGHSAFRTEKYGSWFIETIHHCFMKYGEELSLMQIMTKVNMIVAKIPNKENGKIYMQIPSIINQLRDDVYLKKTPNKAF